MQGIGKAADPGVRETWVLHIERHIDHGRQGVGHQHLHAHPDHEPARTQREILQVETTLIQLAPNPVIANDGAGDRMAEHRNIGGVVNEAAFDRHGAAMHIHQIGNRLQYDKRQPGRHDDPLPVQGHGAVPGGGIDQGAGDDVGVLVPAQHRRVEHDQRCE
ncbi:hypothetical protein D3C85_1343670 [compost metagenome]